jgi:hypothetical protein
MRVEESDGLAVNGVGLVPRCRDSAIRLRQIFWCGARGVESSGMQGRLLVSSSVFVGGLSCWTLLPSSFEAILAPGELDTAIQSDGGVEGKDETKKEALRQRHIT